MTLEERRIAAYRQARVFEPSMDGYSGAMAVYHAAFPEGEGFSDVEALHVSNLLTQVRAADAPRASQVFPSLIGDLDALHSLLSRYVVASEERRALSHLNEIRRGIAARDVALHESRNPDGDGPAVGHIARQRSRALDGTQVPGAGSEPADSLTQPDGAVSRPHPSEESEELEKETLAHDAKVQAVHARLTKRANETHSVHVALEEAAEEIVDLQDQLVSRPHPETPSATKKEEEEDVSRVDR